MAAGCHDSDMVTAAHAFEDEWVSDAIRLFIVFTGITLALVCVRLSVRAFRNAQWESMWGLLSFGCLAVTPAVIGLGRFGEPLLWPSSVVYLAGLAFGIVGLTFRVVLSPPWTRARQKVATRRNRERDREDGKMGAARGRENVALTQDRAREDEAVDKARRREDDAQ